MAREKQRIIRLSKRCCNTVWGQKRDELFWIIRIAFFYIF